MMQQQLPKTLDAIDKSKLPTEVKNKLKEAAINTAIAGNSEGNSNAYTPTSYKGGNGGTNYQVPTTPEGMEDYVNALKTAGLNDSEIATVIKQNAGLTGKPLAQVFTPSVIAALKDIDPEVAQSIVQALAGTENGGESIENAEDLGARLAEFLGQYEGQEIGALLNNIDVSTLA